MDILFLNVYPHAQQSHLELTIEIKTPCMQMKALIFNASIRQYLYAF